MYVHIDYSQQSQNYSMFQEMLLKKITRHNNEKDLDSLNLFCKTLGKNQLNWAVYKGSMCDRLTTVQIKGGLCQGDLWHR